jgi:hypothetical protein
MTTPIRFEVSFWKEDEKGYPGEKVYSKEFDLIGEKTGVHDGDDEVQAIVTSMPSLPTLAKK